MRRFHWDPLTLILFFVLALTVPGPQSRAAPLEVGAGAAALIEAETGEILFAQGADKIRPPASTTKILTGILGLQLAGQEERVTVSRQAGAVETGSVINLRAGDRLLMDNLLKAALIQSANDAAVAVAEQVGGTEEFFAGLMSRQALVLGGSGSHFINSNGYTAAGHYSTARDLAFFSRYALSMPSFAAIVSTRQVRISWLGQARDTLLHNTNQMLNSYYGADGVKTGTTTAAGQCLVASATRGGRQLIAVVLNSPHRYHDATKLLDYGFHHFYRYKMAAGGIFGTVPVRNGLESRLDLVATHTVQFTFPVAELQSLREKIILGKDLLAPVRKGQRIGEVVVYLKGMEMGRTDLLAGNSITKKRWWN